MKLYNQFTILPKYLQAFNYAFKRMKDNSRKLNKNHHLIEDYWNRECRDNPTNNHCKIYCD